MTRTRTRTLAALVAISCAALLASCASDADDAAVPASTIAAATTTSASIATPPSTDEVLTPPTTGLIDPGLQPYIDRSITDLTGRLDVGVEDITVVSALLVEWPDASLGCPQPDVQYAQVETDGSLITLSIDGELYEYHAGGDTTPFLCENSSP